MKPKAGWAASKSRADYTTDEGAADLRARIAEYWKKQNLAPLIRCESEYSDMVDGMPRNGSLQQ